jgi:hypothetical protein
MNRLTGVRMESRLPSISGELAQEYHIEGQLDYFVQTQVGNGSWATDRETANAAPAYIYNDHEGKHDSVQTPETAFPAG